MADPLSIGAAVGSAARSAGTPRPQTSKGGPFSGVPAGGAGGNVATGVGGGVGQSVGQAVSGGTQPIAGYTDPSSGVQLGTRGPNDALASRARPDQTGTERVLEERKDYLYGGREGAAQQAAATAADTGAHYGGLLSGAATRANATGAAYGTAQANQATDDRSLGMDVGSRATDRFLNQDAAGRAMAASGQSAAAGAAGSDAVNRTADQLKLISGERGPSIAQAQLNASTAAAMRQQLALARSGRGLAGGGASLRNAEANQALIQGTANANAATLAAQEENAFKQRQLAAYQAAGGLQGNATQLDLQGNQAAGQLALGAGQYSTGALATGEQQADAGRLGLLGLGAQQLGQGAQTALAGQGLGVQALGQGSQSELAAQALGNQINMGGLQGTMGYEGNITNWRGQDVGVQQAQMQNNIAQQQIDAQKDASLYGMIGTGAAALGSLAMMSDASLKDVGGAGGGSASDMLRGLDTPDPYGGMGDVARGIDTANPYATEAYGTGISGPNQGSLDTPGSSDAYAKSMKQAGDYQQKQDAQSAQMKANAGKQAKSSGQDFTKQAISYFGPMIGKLFSDRTEKTDIRPAEPPLVVRRADGPKARELAALDAAGDSTLRAMQAPVSRDTMTRADIDAMRAMQAPNYGPPTSYPALAQPDQHALDLAAVRETDPYWYRYKQPEKYGEGQRFGIMAQDLAKSPVGRTAVMRMPNGKLAVDTPQLTTINTGALSEQQKQLDAQATQNAGRDAALAELDARTNEILSKLKGNGRPAVGAR